MAIPSKEYWALRAVRREEEAFARGAELSMRLYNAYRQAARELRRAVNDFYVRYAKENSLTYEEAVKALNRAEAGEWKATLGEWVDRIRAEPDPRVRERLTAELDALSYRSRMDRLDALTAQARMTMDELYARSMREMAEEFGEVYRESFYKKSFDLQSRAGRYRPIAGFDAAMIENVMSYPWSGANFSDRLWQNKEALLFNIRQDLTQGLIRGTGLPVLSRDLAERMGQSYKAAERLVRTEVNHFHNEADKAAYRAAGVEWYEFMATLDARTCAVCGALDGKRFKLSEARTGENYPPMHPNDRCTTVEWDPEGETDWGKSGKTMPEDMTYEEWRKRQGLHQTADGSEGVPHGIERVGRMDPSPERIDTLLTNYERQWVGMDHEEAVVVAADGEVFHVMGDGASVDSSALGERLRGAVDFHNHPDDKTYYSFSDKDVGYFLQMGQRECRAADSMYRYVMRRTNQTVGALSEEVEAEFRRIRESTVRELAWNGEIDVDVDEYHETVLRLAEKYHFEYKRVKRDAGG